MQEHRVTAGGQTLALPEPFFVLATQNPIEQEGTYPLPEAQLDRFLFDVRIGYPSAEDEVSVLRATTGLDEQPITPMLTAEEALGLQRLTRAIPAADPLLRYAAAVVRATRPGEPGAPALVTRYVRWGAGPRGGQSLVLGAKAAAVLGGKVAARPEDIRRVAHPVLRHRVLLNYAAEADGITVEQVIEAVLQNVRPPESGIPL
jgi:MoxR-like ATPase